MWALMCLGGKELMRIELMSMIREPLWNTALPMSQSAEQTETKEKSGGSMYSPLTWCDRQTSLKRLDSRLEARLTTLREKEISLEPNSGKEDLQTSTASALPTLSPLIQPQRPPEENTFQLNYPAGTKEPCQTKRERKREKTNKSSNHIKARHYLQTKESKKDRTNMRAYQNFLFRKIPRFIIYFAR